MRLQLREDTGERRPRDHNGRIVSRACPDPNCDGQMVYEPGSERPWRAPQWRCNGITHDDHGGPLVACQHTHVDGEAVR